MDFNGKLLKITAAALAFALIISSFSLSVFADNTETGNKSDRVTSVSYRDILVDMESTVTMKFVKTDVRDALGALSAAFGYETVYIGSNVNITVAIDGATLRDAFNEITTVAGLEWTFDGRTVYVSEAKTIENLENAMITADFRLIASSFDYISSKLSTANIDVVLKNDKSEPNIIEATGNAKDIADLYRLISMVEAIGEKDSSDQGGLYTVSTDYITSNEFSRLLFSLSLPCGISSDKAQGNELIVYTTPSVYSQILATKDVADKDPAALYPSQTALLLAEVSTDYIDTDLADMLLAEHIAISSVKFDNDNNKFWIYATAEQIASANQLLSVADTNDPSVKPIELRLITLDFAPAVDFKALLESFGVTSTYVFEDDPQKIYVFADDATMKDIDVLRVIVDDAEYVDNSSTGYIFFKYEPQFINKSSAADFLATVGCKAKLIEIFGENQAIWLYGDETSINYAKKMFSIFDNDQFKDGYSYRVYNIQNLDFFTLNDKLIYDEKIAQYADSYYIIPIEEKMVIVAAQPVSIEVIFELIQSLDTTEEAKDTEVTE